VRLDDPAFVRDQYATEANLAARKAVHAGGEGDDPIALAFAAVAEVEPGRVLEVGGGEGELAARIVREVGCQLVGIDQSHRMVEIQRGKGIDARVGDVQKLPFADGEFDVALAAWMLYHVPDVELALAELRRVLRSGGRLVAVTNSVDHMKELWDLADTSNVARAMTFRSEDGERMLRRHFRHVRRHDTSSSLILDDAAMRLYASSSPTFAALLKLPPLERPLRVRRAGTVFIAEP
jgi:ubiquinone/menaquinone biosynthesis C-methylase UbiE